MSTTLHFLVFKCIGIVICSTSFGDRLIIDACGNPEQIEGSNIQHGRRKVFVEGETDVSSYYIMLEIIMKILMG